MVVLLLTLRLEIADDVPDVTFLKYYSVWDDREKAKSKTYASVTCGKGISQDGEVTSVLEHPKEERRNTSHSETRNRENSDVETHNKEHNKSCQGQRNFSDIHIELITEEDLTDFIMDSAKPRKEDSGSKQKKFPRKRESKSEPDERPSSSQPGTSDGTQGSSSLRPKSHSPTAKMPNTISFVTGNPTVELTKGILHIFTDNQIHAPDKDKNHHQTERSEMLCMLGVPASHTIHDLIAFIAPMGDYVTYMQVLRDAFPNQYMLLIKFRDQATADEFYSYFNNRPFNSLESDVCHLVYVGKVEIMRESQGGSLPVMDMTELPNCPVCLERMEGSEDGKGILTVLCNHSFHTQCLAQWGDTSCPVCRYCQTPEEVADQRCMQCGSQESLWMCLICGNIGCGRYVGLHSYKHFTDTNHTYAMQLGTNRVWDYTGDNYVHRLAQNKSDGKLVAVDEGGNELREEKLDSITLEYTYLLTSQLESQRLYFMEQMTSAVQDVENKLVDSHQRLEHEMKEKETIEHRFTDLSKEKQTLEKKLNQLHSRTSKVLSELQDEKQMNKCLSENQQQWMVKVTDLETRLKDKDKEMTDLREQLRDVMFYLEAQQKLANTTDVTQAEIHGGQVVVSQGTSSGLGSKKSRKKR